MDEQLKIIISADSKGANDNIRKTKEELEKVEEQGGKTSQSITDTMNSVKQSVTVALAAVAALTAGLVALGKSAMENSKNFAKLNTTFQALGSNAKQAQAAYTGLYRFLGDTGQATEAAALLAQITTEEQELAEWTRILQGQGERYRAWARALQILHGCFLRAWDLCADAHG